MTDNSKRSGDTKRGGIQHGAGFLASGILATLADALVLGVLTRAAGLDPFMSRLIAIACAMVVGFFAHRRLTFAVRDAATLAQFAKFLSVAATAAVLNYAIYATMLVMSPTLEPLIAMLVATPIAMVVSYIGMRFGVFRKPSL